jgi:hypothetical protein
MQSEDKNMDQYFKHRLKDIEVVPPQGVWDSISSSLDAKKKRRRLGLIIGLSAVASLLFAFVGGWYFSQSGYTDQEKLVHNQPQKVIQEKFAQTLPSSQPSVDNKDVTRAFVEEPTFSSKVETTQNNPVSRVVSAKSESNNPVREFLGRMMIKIFPVEGVDFQENITLLAINDGFSASDRAMIEQNMQQQKQLQQTENKSDASGFSVGVKGSPSFRFDSESKGDGYYYDASASSAGAQEYVPSITAGITVAYKKDNRLSVQSGISYDQVEQKGGAVGVSFSGHNWLGNIPISDEYSSPSPEPDNSVALVTKMGVTNFTMPAGTELALANSSESRMNSVARNYELKQQAGYIEVPVIVRYRVVDQRLGFAVLGGINSNFLVTNRASLYNKDETIANGAIDGLNSFVLSSSLGLGMDYAISPRFNITLEPTMKILFNSLNSNENASSRPYAVGVYTGLTYNF